MKVHFRNIIDLDYEYQEKLRKWRNQDFIRFKMFNSSLIEEEQHFKFINSLKNRTDKKLFICFRDDDPFGVLTYDLQENGENIEFGFYLIDEKAMNTGFGAIIEYAILEHAFLILKVKKVICEIIKSNEKVIQMHKKFGFSCEYKDDICFQDIDWEVWSEKRENIKKIISHIMPIENIGDVEQCKIYTR